MITLPQTEAQFQQAVIEAARWAGWKIHHTRPAMMKSGAWATPIQGHIGFPDLVLAHDRYGVMFVELKTTRGRLSEHQSDWIATLASAGAEWHVWRPSDWAFIRDRLAGREMPRA